MKKKFIFIGLTGLLCLSLFSMTGCGDKQPYSQYELTDYVKVGNYKGLEYDKISVSVSDEEVQKEIDARLDSKATVEEVKKGTVAEGDSIVIGYEGRIDGKTFEGGSSDETEIVVGQAGFIDGFEDGLIGQKVGETVSLNLKFPDSYSNDSVAGKPVTFEVNIKSKKVRNVPAYNLDFVKENSDSKSLEEYEDSVKEDLLKKKTTDAENEQKTQLWQQIVEDSEVIKYPEEKDEAIEEEVELLKQDAAANNLSYEEYLAKSGYSEEDMKALITTYCENKFFEEMVLYSIAEKEGIEITDKEYEEQVDKLLESSGMDEKTFEASYKMSIEEWCEYRGIRAAMLLDKVMTKVMEYGSQK